MCSGPSLLDGEEAKRKGRKEGRHVMVSGEWERDGIFVARRVCGVWTDG